MGLQGKMSSFDECFKVAFGVIISGLEGADDAPLSILFEALSSNPGSIRNKAREFNRCLSEFNWTWPAYEESDLQRRKNEHQAKIDAILNESKLSFLSKLTNPELKSIIASHPFGSKAICKVKNDFIHAASKVIDDNHLEGLKISFIRNLPQPSIRSRIHVAEALSARIEGLTYRLVHWESLQKTVAFLPYWELKTKNREMACAECQINSDKIQHYTEPFWTSFNPICQNIHCSCYIKSHSTRENTGKA